MRNTIIVLLLMGSISGCASAGIQAIKGETTETVATKITKGRSTTADVRRAFGDPTSTSFTDSGNELWNYEYAKATPKAANFVPIVGIFAGGMDVDKKTLVFFFDKNGVVQNYSVSAAKTETLNNR